MQKIFLKYKISSLIILFVIGYTLIGQNLFAQSQNPFEIKSRKYIDTTSRPVNEIDSSKDHVPVGHKPITTLSDTTDLSSTSLAPSENIPSDASINNSDSTGHSAIGSLPTAPKNENLSAPPSENENKNSGFTFSNTQSDPDSQSISWWYYIFDLILLLILLGAFIYDKKIFPPLRKAFLHENFLRFLYRDTYLRKPGLFIYLNILFLLSLGFIIFRAAEHFGQASTFREYLIIQGVVFSLFLIKHVALHLLSRLVDKPFEVKFYQYWMILSGGLMGLWMIPLALMVSVLPFEFLYIALIISFVTILSLLVYRLFKAMFQAKIFLSKHFFQYFLYFCAVEIVPAVLLADILVHY